MTTEGTKIQVKLLKKLGSSEATCSASYAHILHVQEETSLERFNVEYSGRGQAEFNYYLAIMRDIGKNSRLELCIEGNLEEERVQYKGIGKIRILPRNQQCSPHT